MQQSSTHTAAGQYQISAFCKIKNGEVSATDFSLNEPDAIKDFTALMKILYASLQLDYPKFFKMDQLSKLAFITSEVLLKNTNLKTYEQEKIGIVLGNSFATKETDLDYYKTIQDKTAYFPSPSVFVYTLPNIMIGEICIRNKFKGENAFFVFKEFNHNFIHQYVMDLLQTGKVDCCITGWVDYKHTGYESILFLIEPKDTFKQHIPYTSEATRKLYSS